MTRKRLALSAAFVVLAAIIAWLQVRPPDPRSLVADRVTRVEIQFRPWGEDEKQLPDTASEDREAIANFVTVIKSGHESTEHKCGSLGVVRFQRSFGLPARLEFLPGHDKEWYEFRTGGKLYRVARTEFLDAMHRLGTDAPTGSE